MGSSAPRSGPATGRRFVRRELGANDARERWTSDQIARERKQKAIEAVDRYMNWVVTVSVLFTGAIIVGLWWLIVSAIESEMGK